MKIVGWSPKERIITAEHVIKVEVGEEEIEKEADRIRKHYLVQLGRPSIITWKKLKTRLTFEIMFKSRSKEEAEELLSKLS